MALRKYNPKTPGTRQLVLIDRSSLYKGKPLKALTEGKNQAGELPGICGQRHAELDTGGKDHLDDGIGITRTGTKDCTGSGSSSERGRVAAGRSRSSRIFRQR